MAHRAVILIGHWSDRVRLLFFDSTMRDIVTRVDGFADLGLTPPIILFGAPTQLEDVFDTDGKGILCRYCLKVRVLRNF